MRNIITNGISQTTIKTIPNPTKDFINFLINEREYSIEKLAQFLGIGITTVRELKEGKRKSTKFYIFEKLFHLYVRESYAHPNTPGAIVCGGGCK